MGWQEQLKLLQLTVPLFVCVYTSALYL